MSRRPPEVQLAPSVLVVGTGGSGLRAAIEVAERGIDVLAVGKRRTFDAHTTLAAGGISAAPATMDRQDTWQQYAADTLTESCLLADPRTVQIVPAATPASGGTARRGARSTTGIEGLYAVGEAASGMHGVVGARCPSDPRMRARTARVTRLPSPARLPAARSLDAGEPRLVRIGRDRA